jgi:hypothetical protein
VQAIPWDQLVGEAGVLPDPCGGGALHGSEIYLTGVDTQSGTVLEEFIVIKKKNYYLKIIKLLMTGRN